MLFNKDSDPLYTAPAENSAGMKVTKTQMETFKWTPLNWRSSKGEYTYSLWNLIKISEIQKRLKTFIPVKSQRNLLVTDPIYRSAVDKVMHALR